MRSDHAGKFKSSKTARPLPSPRKSDKNSENFGAAFGSKYTSDGKSIKTTKTGVLKEMLQNESRLTQLMSKKGIMTTVDSRFNGMIVLDLESVSNEEIYRKPQFRQDSADDSRSRVRQQKSFAEIEMLEGMVRTKDDLVSMIDDSEENIEKLMDSLTSKKKEIRDEQNKLLKELEDLGLKLKDFDKPVSINLRYCTVVSPYLTRCSQQVVNKLAGVSENLSNKETKNEIQRAVESISKEREERETLVISLLSLDTTTLRERLNMLLEDLKSKNTEKVAAVERIELLASEIIELDEAIKEELQYQEKLDHLKSLKETAVNRASRAANVLNEIAKKKVELENEIRDIHSNIRYAVKDKNELSGELNNIIDTQSYQPMVHLWQKIDESDLEENNATKFMSEFVTKLKLMEISRQMDYDMNTQESISSTRELYIGAINLAGRVLSMLGKNNAESAITSFEDDCSALDESSQIPAALATKTREILRDLFEIVKIKFDEEQKSKSLDLWIENIKIYLIETCKISENLYSVLTKRSELSKSIKTMIDDVQAKEQQCSDLNRQRSDIINTIPELKQDARSCNHQLAILQSQSTATANDGDETPRETVDEMDEEILGQWTQRNACPERFCTKEQIKASRASESERLQARVQVLSEGILEVEDSVQQMQHEQHYIQDKIRAYRRGLIEGFQHELKEFHCIASLFDYMSKPILSREIGVSVVDNLLHDLASVVQQINSEINRQKRIIKHLSKGEDYSHEGKPMVSY